MCYCTMNNYGERDTLRGVSTIAQRGTGGTIQVDSGQYKRTCTKAAGRGARGEMKVEIVKYEGEILHPKYTLILSDFTTLLYFCSIL